MSYYRQKIKLAKDEPQKPQKDEIICGLCKKTFVVTCGIENGFQMGFISLEKWTVPWCGVYSEKHMKRICMKCIDKILKTFPQLLEGKP